MKDETNTPDAGTDNVAPEQDDTEESWDYFDPDEDTEEEPPPPSTDDGTEEAESEDAVEEAEEAPATVEFTLPDGTKVDKDELVRGYHRQSDYTRKMQEVATLKQSVSSRATELDGIVAAFTDHISSLMPPEPDPGLALRDPNAYVRAKAQYDAAKAQVEKLIEVGRQPKTVIGALSDEDQRALMIEGNRRMIEMFPQAGTKEGRPKFLEGVSKAAMDVGFSMADLQKVSDPRLFALAHWANIGMKSAAASKTVREKVKAAPSPVKPGAGAARTDNRDAMRRLIKSGSIRDAMKVDFD